MNRKQAQKRARQKQRQQTGAAYLVEGRNGFLTRVPAEKLRDFQAAQKQPDRPLSKAEQQLSDKIVREIFG